MVVALFAISMDKSIALPTVPQGNSQLTMPLGCIQYTNKDDVLTSLFVI
jgi:hypothetical protein